MANIRDRKSAVSKEQYDSLLEKAVKYRIALEAIVATKEIENCQAKNLWRIAEKALA